MNSELVHDVLLWFRLRHGPVLSRTTVWMTFSVVGKPVQWMPSELHISYRRVLTTTPPGVWPTQWEDGNETRQLASNISVILRVSTFLQHHISKLYFSQCPSMLLTYKEHTVSVIFRNYYFLYIRFKIIFLTSTVTTYTTLCYRRSVKNNNGGQEEV